MSRLGLPLSDPQAQHALTYMEGLISLDGTRTAAEINRLLGEPTDPSVLTDFRTYSPWSAEQVEQAAVSQLVPWITRAKVSPEVPLLISIDDSLAKRAKTSKHFEGIEWHFDAKGDRRYGYGLVFVDCHMQYGHRAAALCWRPYLRESTVRKLNRNRPKECRLRFRTKYELASEMLEEIAPLVPNRLPVFVMFDSWYASAKLIRDCRVHDWHVICSLKKNRTLDGKQISLIARRSRNKSFRPIWVSSAESSTRYLVRKVTGRISDLAERVSVAISKRHSGEKNPEYFLCTKPKYSVRKVLSHYTWRWAVEVNHLYAKLRLGAEDFRVRSVEGISKHFTLCFLALAYLYWRLGGSRRATRRKLAEIIACHRRENERAFLKAFGEAVLAARSVEKTLKDFLPAL